MTLRLLPLLIMIVVLLMAVAPRRAAAQEAPGAGPAPESERLLRLLPPGAESVICVHSVPEFMSAFLQTPFHAIYENPRYRAFLGPLVELLEIETPDLGFRIRRPNAAGPVPLPGALVSATYPQEGRGGDGSSRVVFYETQPGDGPTTLELILATSQGSGMRVNRATEPVAGKSVVALQRYRQIRETIQVRGKAKKYRREFMEDRGIGNLDAEVGTMATQRELEEELFYAGSDFVVRCSGGRELLAEVIRRVDADEGTPSLAQQPKWFAPRGALRSSPQVVFYRDLRPERGSGRRKLDDNELRLGLHEIRSLVGGLNLLEDRLSLEIAVYVPPPRTGLGRLLFINEPIDQPRFESRGFLPVEGYRRDAAELVPADAVAWSAFSADLARLWTEAYRILQTGAPEIAELLDIYFQTQGVEGDFASRFASTFGSRWLTFSRYPTGEAGRSSEPELTALMELRDSEALAPVLNLWLQNLSQLLNLQIEQYTVSGRHYYKLEGAETLDPELTPLGPIGYLCLAENWLILSVRQEHILAALARLQGRSEAGSTVAETGAPLMRDRGYVALRGSFAPERFFEAYALPAAKDQVMISPILLLLGEALDDASTALIDLDEAPRDSVWRAAFGTWGVSMRSTPESVVADFALMYRDTSE